MKFFKIIIISIFVLIILYFGILYIPSVFITEEGQKCLVDTNCFRIEPICSEINKNIQEGELGQVEPMCLNQVCRCEWVGNLLHFKN